MKTFERLTKKSFIKELNDRVYDNWIGQRGGYRFKNSLCYIGSNIGLNIVESRTKTKGVPSNSINVFYIIDNIPNYITLIKHFNLSNSIGVIGNDGYLIKDNFNAYRESIGLKRFTPANFNKLKELSGYKLTKDAKSFNKLNPDVKMVVKVLNDDFKKELKEKKIKVEEPFLKFLNERLEIFDVDNNLLQTTFTLKFPKYDELMETSKLPDKEIIDVAFDLVCLSIKGSAKFYFDDKISSKFQVKVSDYEKVQSDYFDYIIMLGDYTGYDVYMEGLTEFTLKKIYNKVNQ